MVLYLMRNLSWVTYEINEEQKRRAIANWIPLENFTVLEDALEEKTNEDKIKSLKSEIFDNTDGTIKFKKIRVKKIKV